MKTFEFCIKNCLMNVSKTVCELFYFCFDFELSSKIKTLGFDNTTHFLDLEAYGESYCQTSKMERLVKIVSDF